MKKFSKNVDKQDRPGFRTPSAFRSKQFEKQSLNVRFNPGSFKIQHKG